MLRFAPGEPYFPTLPFFYAFDGIDNNNNGRVDFDDLDEIAAFNPGDTLYPSWRILDDWYNGGAGQAVAARRDGRWHPSPPCSGTSST